MKKNILSMACVMLMTGAFAQTQVIKANPLGLLLGLGNLSYELGFGSINYKDASDASKDNYISYQLNLNYGQLPAPGGQYTAIGGGIDVRSYAFSRKENAPNGLYLSFGTSYLNATLKIDGEKDTNHIIAPKLTLGYQLILDNGFSLDLFGGIMYNHNFNDGFEINRVKYDEFKGFMPTAGLAFGYAFGKD